MQVRPAPQLPQFSVPPQPSLTVLQLPTGQPFGVQHMLFWSQTALPQVAEVTTQPQASLILPHDALREAQLAGVHAPPMLFGLGMLPLTNASASMRWASL